MVNQDLVDAIELTQDYQTRTLVVLIIIAMNLFIYFYSNRLEEEQDWQRLRNFFLRSFSIVVITLMILWVPLFLNPTYDLEAMTNIIINFYTVAFTFTTILIYV